MALAQEEAAAKSRRAVADLKAAGLSGADIAAVLDLSPQRLSQLAERTPEDDHKRAESVLSWARERAKPRSTVKVAQPGCFRVSKPSRTAGAKRSNQLAAAKARRAAKS
ncbi:hypothetical protein GCM10011581_17530 [Saccharopolyspora subtropica]|uniref:Uncharacterized protein n=1 Tax=Saccharopolyspora thermophila TaxID=89367 RepID=A0A917NBF4_9PSEU|nr:hypothetical protein GCM10011581_17530 [Saccharopolyspora subtropica]